MVGTWQAILPRTGIGATIGMDPVLDWIFGDGRRCFFGPHGAALIPLIIQPDAEKTVAVLHSLSAPDRKPPDGEPLLRLSPCAGYDLAIHCPVPALAEERFFHELSSNPRSFEGLAELPKTIEVGRPLPARLIPRNHEIETPEIGPPQGGWPGKTAIVAVIDDGIAFAHERFRMANGTSRIACFWHMDGESNPPPPTVPFGREILKSEIDAALAASTTPAGIDEDAVYRATGMLDFTRPEHKAIAWRLAHGTHVLDIAAGAWPSENVAERPIIAVQLPAATTANTSGTELAPILLHALSYIQSRAALLSGNGPTLPVVLNFSYGFAIGPHDGSSLLDTALNLSIDETFRVVLPAGNDNLLRTHARIRLGNPGDVEVLQWKVLPDDRTCTSMELWLPRGGGATDDTVDLVVTTPDGTASPAIPAIAGHGAELIDAAGAICRVRFAFRGGLTDRGYYRIDLQPTRRLGPSVGAPPVAPAGTWEVALTKKSPKLSGPIDVWIHRDDKLYGYPRLGRQSYFVNPCFPRFKHPSGARETEDLPGAPCSIRRSGQINGLATGAEVHVVGAWRRDTGELTEYSSAGETTGPPRKPDVVLVGDDSRVHFGVLAAGSRSGGAVPMNGTSVAAPALTRKIADLLANGDQTTRLDIQGLADPGPPPLPDNRAGAGRINHDPVRDAKRRET